jgi:hypothetical protein
VEIEDGWLVKVQKLLAMAEDPGASPAEAEAFSRKAEELMAKYAIDEAMLQAKGERPREKVTTITIELTDPYASIKRDLVFSIASSFGAKAIWLPSYSYVGGRRKRSNTMRVVGHESDLAKVEMLTGSLLVQLSRAIVHTPPQGNTRAFRTALCVGFKDRVWRRLADIRAKAKADASKTSTGTDLVLRDRKTAVDAEFRVLYPQTVKVPQVVSRSFAGYNRGWDEGGRADIGQSRMGGQHTKALA